VRATDRAVVPGVVGEWLRHVHASQELTVDAALRGDRDLVYQAMRLDPLCAHRSYDEVLAMTDDLLQATTPWLPQFTCEE
jgi:alpha-galactosidase/6-phospho-beta-glucosidase family protein